MCILPLHILSSLIATKIMRKFELRLTSPPSWHVNENKNIHLAMYPLKGIRVAGPVESAMEFDGHF